MVPKEHVGKDTVAFEEMKCKVFEYEKLNTPALILRKLWSVMRTKAWTTAVYCINHMGALSLHHMGTHDAVQEACNFWEILFALHFTFV